jgi:hypothetical protein
MSSPEEDGSKAATPITQHSIAYNGRIYQVGLFQYDQLADAIAYARQRPGEAGSAPTPAAAMEGPDESQQLLMDSLGITFRDGVYHLGDYRYGRLADAANFARLRRTQGIS